MNVIDMQNSQVQRCKTTCKPLQYAQAADFEHDVVVLNEHTAQVDYMILFLKLLLP